MIQKEPNLPIVRHSDIHGYLDDLNWTLTQRLREMATAINQFSGSTWDGPHPVLGTSHIWVDATGDLRIKSSAPTSDLDGVVIGTQS
jgi:hypothetical protein